MGKVLFCYDKNGGIVMDINVKTLMDLKIERTKNALLYNNMETIVVENKKELQNVIEQMILPKSKVSVGGSQTLFEAGIIDLLRQMDIQFNDRYDPNIKPEEMNDLHRLAFSADYLIMSSNAVTEDGLLYNVDGNGNRLAALIFGPKNVIVVVGYNKIVKDIDEAVQRVKSIAAPANALRLNKDTPCTNFGECRNCRSRDRICSHFVTTGYQSHKGRIKVIIVKEKLGY